MPHLLRATDAHVRRQELRHPNHARIRPVHIRKGIIDIQIAKVRELLGKRGVVLLLPLMEAEIFEEENLTGAKGKCNRDIEEFLKDWNKWFLAEYSLKPLPLRPALMREENEGRPRIEDGAHGGKHRPYALRIENTAMLHGNIEPRPQQHTLPPHVRLIKSPILHGS